MIVLATAELYGGKALPLLFVESPSTHTYRSSIHPEPQFPLL